MITLTRNQSFSLNLIATCIGLRFMVPLMTLNIIALLVTIEGINVVIGCNYGLSLPCPGESCLDIYHKNPKSRGTSKQFIMVTVSNCPL